MKYMSTLERFRSHYTIEKGTNCWIWHGSKNKENGYPTFHTRGINRYAHTWIYEHLFEPVPEGYELDHLCTTPSCVNPFHLEIVTHDENIQRSRDSRYWNPLLRDFKNSLKKPLTNGTLIGYTTVIATG
jgi:HNH endonuclease